jgi:AraC-like DNA-binding protein
VRRAVRFIEEDLCADLRLEEIASRVGLSRSHFFQQFRLCVGASPLVFANWARLKIADDWLADPKGSLGDLSEHLGFSAPSHFCRFFKKHLGVSPTYFQRQLRHMH